MSKLLFVSFLLCVTISLNAQKFSFVTYSTEQGLPQSQVTAINQDGDGYLWVGTLGGLAKFGGNKFTTYSSNEGLLNSRVTSLDFFESTLWVGHDGGISSIKHGKISSVGFTGNGNDKSRGVSKIIRFKNKLLVCSNRGGLFEMVKNKLVRIPLSSSDYEQIRSAYVYKDKIYFATKGGILVSTNGKSFQRIEELGEESYSGVTGRGHLLVFSSYNNGVFVKDMLSGNTAHYSSESLKYSIYGCYIDRSNRIWLNTLDGGIQINAKGHISFFNDTNGLPVNMIGCFFNDSDNNIWIGSQGKGIFRFPGEDIKYYDQSTGFPTDLFLGGFQDKNNDYYFATYDKGILKKKASGEVEVLSEDERTIWTSLPNIDGKHWFGTARSLVSISKSGDYVSYSNSRNKEIPGTKITALYRISENSMYIGGNSGVSIYSKGNFRKIGLAGKQEIGTVRDFEIIDNVMFCGTNLGLFQYKNGEFKLVEGCEQVIYNLEKDQNGDLWYGSEEGLYHMKNGVVKRVALLNDSGSNFIDCMNYRNGKLYIGTNNGLFIVSELNKPQQKIERLGIGDGVVDLETNLNSGFFDNKGDFWFGTASGLVRYHISDSPKKRSKPKVNLTSILLNYETFEYADYTKKLTENGFPKELTLPFSKNNLIFELDGVSLVDHKGMSYQFWLEGLRDTWSSLSENPTITFTSLPAGEYRLHVRAVDIDGLRSDEIHFPFTIKEAIYKTWWFISLVFLLIAGLTILIFRLRLRRIAELNEKEKVDYKSKLLALEQKSMNASMNRHFIFNSLNSIQYFINTQDRVSANKYLTNFAQLIRKNLDSAMKEGDVITLEEELERIELYLSLESMRFKDRFDYEINVVDVDLEAALIPPMIMQPFVENSIIHGILPNENKKGLIKINISIIDGYLNISIEDNGIGINQSLARKNVTDGDHRSQGMEITSKRIELMQKLTESDISLIGPVEIVGNDRSINGTRVLIKIPMLNLEN